MCRLTFVKYFASRIYSTSTHASSFDQHSSKLIWPRLVQTHLTNTRSDSLVQHAHSISPSVFYDNFCGDRPKFSSISCWEKLPEDVLDLLALWSASTRIDGLDEFWWFSNPNTFTYLYRRITDFIRQSLRWSSSPVTFTDLIQRDHRFVAEASKIWHRGSQIWHNSHSDASQVQAPSQIWHSRLLAGAQI